MKVARVLPVIVIAQFFCTSLWFAGNAVLPDMIRDFRLEESALGHITSAVQFGFITGTLVFASLLIADRFRASFVFFICAILGAVTNLGITISEQSINSLLILRFSTGFFLAGIYPVGMKIASDHFEKGLGKALGFLVGALVVGTAFPHLLKSFASSLPWKAVLFFTAGLSVSGGIMMLLIPNGPYRKRSQALNFGSVFGIFRNPSFRSAALGYFGHMWELYAFWAFVPVILTTYQKINPVENINIAFYSFLIIALGGLACIISGYLSQRFGSKRIAFIALLLSGCCCIASPFSFYLPLIPFIIFLIFWGLVVIADSPLFSTLVAQHAPAELRGTAITTVTCIGFSITIISIELLTYLTRHINMEFIYLVLAAGPLAGLIFMLRGKNNK